jgi:hypothetical protein
MASSSSSKSQMSAFGLLGFSAMHCHMYCGYRFSLVLGEAPTLSGYSSGINCCHCQRQQEKQNSSGASSRTSHQTSLSRNAISASYIMIWFVTSLTTLEMESTTVTD